MRSSPALFVALALGLAGCAGPATTTLAPATVSEGSASTSPRRLGALQVIVEAWPDGSGEDDPAALVDGDLHTAFTTAPDLRGPWSFVLRVVSGPADVAAVGIPVRGLPTDPAELAVFSLLGAWDLTHETWSMFVENSVRHGLGVVPQAAGVVVFAFREWTPAHMVWVRVHTTRSAQSVVLPEIYVFDSEQLVALRENPPAGYSIVDLLAVDTDPYQGINLTGLPNLDGPDLIEDGSGPESDEGSR